MITTTLRIDQTTYDKLCSLANKDNRSINAEMVYIIKAYIEMLKWNNKK